ncbi:putative xyloglucan:xyloglucosyl transferase [Lupinus albus]|uniref:Xyloglucan endotransglucosylase/hydrolase n=1 Tax=Lupinus albus TaxID=3870 RepID=A0A6A4PLS6_LUPAL|nr:putative xyloglucan:xyloglucosyl transferase [Lupinus albus]
MLVIWIRTLKSLGVTAMPRLSTTLIKVKFCRHSHFILLSCIWQLHSEGLSWDEIDFEFLGNVSGDPYVVHTNIYTQGKGNRQQQFYLWFDPTTNFHNFSILWNPHCIINDGIKGGVVKTNWTEAPFTALFKNFNANACVWSYAASSCTSNSSSSVGEWITQGLGAIGEEKMKSVHRNYIIYNYCTDMKRFPTGLPPECTISVY